MPTFGSLFSGVGGLDLGLERAGWECKFQVEIDPFCRAVLTKHWPAVPKYADVRELSGNELEPVDLLAGGFPCQDVSNAGKRQGLAGAHSRLWSEFARLIRVVRPRLVLVENVPGLLGRGMGTVLGDLAALGFDAEWDVLRASDCGAPHIRARLFLIAERSERRATARSAPRILADARHGLERLADQPWRTAAPDLAQGRAHVATPAALRQPDSEHGMGDGLSAELDRLRGLGNAVVPQVAEWLGRRLLTALEPTDA